MTESRFALRLLARGGDFGAREELVGDLLEEIARGRSDVWVCQQLIGVYGFAFMSGLRARVTPHAIALAMGLVLLLATSFASARVVLAVWLGFYYVMGTLSLFAHMASHTIGGRAGAISTPADDPRG
jgi:hypothetical protein